MDKTLKLSIKEDNSKMLESFIADTQMYIKENKQLFILLKDVCEICSFLLHMLKDNKVFSIKIEKEQEIIVDSNAWIESVGLTTNDYYDFRITLL